MSKVLKACQANTVVFEQFVFCESAEEKEYRVGQVFTQSLLQTPNYNGLRSTRS